MQANAEQNTCNNIWVHYGFAFHNYQNRKHLLWRWITTKSFQQPFKDIIIINHYGIQYQTRNLRAPMKKTICLICLQSQYVTM